MGGDMIISRIAPHFYEEPPISGTRGSGTVFFSGCTMRCSYCQNAAISRAPAGKTYTPYTLSEKLKELEDMGVHNINFVTPTHFSDKIKETLDLYRPSLPIVYNTSGYELPSVIEGLKGYVDIYLPDYKYADCRLSEELSLRKNYPAYAEEAIALMRKQVKDRYFEDGIMQSGVIIRHLVLPGYLENSKLVIDRIAALFPNTFVSVMSQFTPVNKNGKPCRPLKPIEYKIILAHAEKAGLCHVFTQEISSSSTEYIPQWET